MTVPNDSLDAALQVPAQRRVSAAWLAFGLLAAPLAWLLEEYTFYGIASHVCAAGWESAGRPPLQVASPWFWVVTGTALAVALGGAWTAWANWRKTRDGTGNSGGHLLERGEGGSRFVSMCGLLAGAGSLVGLAFLFMHLVLAPLCVR
ncbi:MAG: hypothetical protein M3150_08675 [Pseudomonadota bacterium]|nr:hypothetical protein [Pseudomonadota bacterium]